VVKAALTPEGAWEVLSRVPDPEVPVLSVVDLGIIRGVRVTDAAVEVDVTPTYSGCPAMRLIEEEIEGALLAAGAERVTVRTVYQPAWTTDWISAAAKERLRAYGIAPPGPATDDASPLVPLLRRAPTVPCPFCGSARTEQRSEFGSTACKALYVCSSCRQPFEHFKAI
jgi:ring-1,2-phenylacetyl-CoA epoxidase subunit PaaD